MLFSILYTFFLHIFCLGAIPYTLYKRIRFGKYKSSFWAKFGVNFPLVEKQDRVLIWVHAVSLGETKAVVPLLKKIKSEMKDCMILLSSITETGFAEGEQSLKGIIDAHVFLPFDLPYIIKPIVASVKPDLVLVVETDFWYHFQMAAKEAGAEVIAVNAKISERSFKRYSFLPWLTASVFHTLDFFCVQSETYKMRFLELGIPPDHIKVTGNLKLDDSYEELSAIEKFSLKQKLRIKSSDKVIVVGSTHDPEEKLILKELTKVWRRYPNLKVFLVPRHPERFKAVASLLEREKYTFSLWSEGKGFLVESKLMLVDAMGVLRKLYQLSDVAIVAGSFTDKVGGHNLLEPSWYSKPSLFGLYTFNQKDFASLILQMNAGYTLDVHEIADLVLKLLMDDKACLEIGKNGKKIFNDAKGAVDKTYLEIQKQMQLKD